MISGKKTLEILDESWRKVGVSYVVLPLIRPGGDGQNAFPASNHFHFRDGELPGIATNQRPNDQTPNPRPITIVINGGGGIYEGVTGTVEIMPGDDPVFRFNLTCDRVAGPPGWLEPSIGAGGRQ